MNTRIKNLFLLLALLAGSNLGSTSLATAQNFTTIKSFGILTNVTGANPQSTLVQGVDGTLYGTATYGEGTVQGTVFKMQPDGSGFITLKFFTNRLDGWNPSAGLALSGNTLYGTTAYGGISNYGTVFRLNTDGSGFTVLKNFTGSDGANPYAASVALSGGVLYGTTYGGGSSGYGTVFKLNTDGSAFTVLKSFPGFPDGALPDFALTESGGVLYGTTENGGTSGAGTLFKLNTDGTGYAVLVNFTNSPDGAYPDSVLTLSGSALYGTTYRGGSNYLGTVFRVNTDGTGYTVLRHFTVGDGAQPAGPLPLSGGVLYGTTTQAGSNGVGTVFRINTDGTAFAVLQTFTNSTDGATPVGGLMLAGSILYGTTRNGGAMGLGSVFQIHTDGSGYSVLKNLANSGDGIHPNSDLTLSDAVLYGTTSDGGSFGHGTLFKVNTNGTGYSVLKNFAGGNDGASPSGTMPLSGGVLYGTTQYGGAGGNGTVFKVNTDGTDYAVLKNFTNIDGGVPQGGLTLSGGVLYGATSYGGGAGLGTVFQLNTDGTGFSVLKQFASDGHLPYAGLVSSGSVLYGTTLRGGTWDHGTVFKVNADGTGFTVLKSFTGTDGWGTEAPLVLSGSALYGTTYLGGNSNLGTVFVIGADGTGFAVLRHFTGSPDGSSPVAGLTVSGGVLYGTTASGGTLNDGTVFKISTNGSGFAVLHNFTGSPDGSTPQAGLTLSSGVLYGTTLYGGSDGQGTVYKLNTIGTGYTVLHNFIYTPTDGRLPYAGLTLTGSVLYGTTTAGGSSDYGTVFRVSTTGAGYALLHNFTDSPDGSVPQAGLLLSGSVLYGTTLYGGGGAGTVFKLNTSGSGFTVLHNFANDNDTTGGNFPYAGLTLSGGVLYGTTTSGGGAGLGTVFQLNTDGTGYTVLKAFATDGEHPQAGLTLSGSLLYGTTLFGGAEAAGSVFAIGTNGAGFTNLYSFATHRYPYFTNSTGFGPWARLTVLGNTLYGTAFAGGISNYGTVFALNTDGTSFTILHQFTGPGDGRSPQAGLIPSGSVLFGTATGGGSTGAGTVFALNTDGTGFTTLRSLIRGSDGSEPSGGLVLSGNTLYGTAQYGGDMGEGTVFSLSPRPQLGIAPSGANVVLTWPATLDYNGYTLQSTTSLVPPVIWTTTFPTPVVIGGQLTVTNPIIGAQQFYRLVQ